MNKNIIYIVGAVALLGGGAFLFLRNKKAKDKLKLADLQSVTTGVPTTGASVPATNPSTGLPIPQIKDDTKNIEEAMQLANKIASLKNKKTSYILMPLKEFSNTAEGFYGRFEVDRLMLEKYKADAIANMENQLKDLNNQISKLGYIESNGNITKIN
jgi:LPXTG-motif cell wall-anchored protein